MTTNTLLYADRIKYRVEDFEPITTVFRGPLGVAVPATNPARNFAELIEYAKGKGGRLDYGAAGAGSSPHLLMVAAGKRASVETSLISYKGEPAGIADLLGGHLPAYLD
jgi:tripartite-type tricarboxylate transporter receptor subunit TctC